MSFLSRFRSYQPPFEVAPAVIAAMSTDATLPELPRRVAIPAVVDPVRVLDWPVDEALHEVPAYVWDDPGAIS